MVLSDLFRGLSDLHLGDQKVTWKKLALFGFCGLGFGAGFRAPCSQAEIEFLFDGLDVNQIDYLYEAKKG